MNTTQQPGVITRTIELGGNTYTLAATMGAFLQYQIATVTTVAKMDTEDPTAICTFAYHCAHAGARITGVPLELDLMQWLDLITVVELKELAEVIGVIMQDHNGTTEADQQKKMAAK
jgi:hypothetical protein